MTERTTGVRSHYRRLLVEQWPRAMAYVDSQLRLRHASPAFAAWLDADRVRLVGAPLQSLMGSAQFEVFEPCLRAALAGEAGAIWSASGRTGMKAALRA